MKGGAFLSRSKPRLLPFRLVTRDMASIDVITHLHNRDYLPFVRMIDHLHWSCYIPRSATPHPADIRNLLSYLALRQY